MPKVKPDEVQWLDDVTGDDYSAARNYLLLIRTPSAVKQLITALKAAPVTQHKAVDLLRASRVKLAKTNDPPCRKEIKKIKDGDAISPVLLVRDPAHGATIIADGYHRICAAFQVNPDVVVHCKIV